MTGSEASAIVPGPDAAPTPWHRHDDGRWIIEDAGRQPDVVAVPAPGKAGIRPDTVIDGGRVRGVVYRATSQRGFAHQERGTPRQDAYLVRPTPDRRWLVGCVADGVSEGKLSHEAADLVCQETTVRLARGLSRLAADGESATGEGSAGDWAEAVASRLPWSDVVEAASESVRQAARTAFEQKFDRTGNTAEREEFEKKRWDDQSARAVMSSTAVVFAVHTEPAPDGDHPAFVAMVAGDSTALLLDGDAWTPIGAVKNEGAEIMSSAVVSLPGPVRVQSRAFPLRPGQALVVITDGLGEPLGSGGGVVGRFLSSMWREPPGILAFAEHVGFYRKSFADDRTAVAVWALSPREEV